MSTIPSKHRPMWVGFMRCINSFNCIMRNHCELKRLRTSLAFIVLISHSNSHKIQGNLLSNICSSFGWIARKNFYAAPAYRLAKSHYPSDILTCICSPALLSSKLVVLHLLIAKEAAKSVLCSKEPSVSPRALCCAHISRC